MGDTTFLDLIRDWVGNVAFKALLWSLEMTQEEYWREIYRTELFRAENSFVEEEES